MKVLLINKSDSTGGAAVVSRRLMDALREQGVDAKMLVIEKLTDSPYVIPVTSVSKNPLGPFSKLSIKLKFLSERLKIFLANGLNRSTLFKIDTGDKGLPLWNNRLVKESDAILINWVNQGMLSLKGFKKILQLGKPVIWTMHDMWEMTGICHHAGTCDHFKNKCGDCPLLVEKASPIDLSHKIWQKKHDIYSDRSLSRKLVFVAVSRWLKEKASMSSLLGDQRVEVIGNVTPLKPMKSQTPSKSPTPSESPTPSKSPPNRGDLQPEIQAINAFADGCPVGNESKVRILFGAARLDDPIKGLDTLKYTAKYLKENYPIEASKLEIAFFGNVKNPEALEGFDLPIVKLGILHGEDEVMKAYKKADIVVSASSYETLPGTLVEAQAYGCIPVSFNQGGQRDIVDHKKTGYIAEYSEDMKQRAENLGQGILWALKVLEKPEVHEKMLLEMRKSVEEKFSYEAIAKKYLEVIESAKCL